MKNTLAENLLRFGVKNLSESDKSKLNEQTEPIDRRDWANKQVAAIKNLTLQLQANKFPISPVVIGPYCLVTVMNTGELNAQKIKEGADYIGDVIGWTANRMGLPSLTSLQNGEVGYFKFNTADKFGVFEVSTSIVDKSINALNKSFNQLSLDTIQTMWKSSIQAVEVAKYIPTFKTNVLAYQANPTDATKGYDKITGNAAAFLKSLKFA